MTHNPLISTSAPMAKVTVGTTPPKVAVGTPGPAGPKGDDLGTPVVTVAHDEEWPPPVLQPGVLYLRLGP